MSNRIYIISELCGQWGGSLKRAQQMILQSKMGGADAVKVQLWDTYRLPGQNRAKWEYLSMSEEQFLNLKQYAESLELDYFASAFHEDRFEWIKKADIKINKIASPLLEWDKKLCTQMVKSGMKTYISLGKWEEDFLPFKDDNVSYMHCVSKYPHDLKEAIEHMPETFSEEISGYSDHVIGIEACKEAVRRGATVIEKHFTIGPELQCETESAHVCSMTYDQLRDLRNYCDAYKS
jgi:sialic acid synthase SpsE